MDFIVIVLLDLLFLYVLVEEDWNKGNDKEDDSVRLVYYES